MRQLTLPGGGGRVPLIGQGTWGMGLSRQRRAREVAALRQGIALGMTLIDTATLYAGGGAESVVGEAVAGLRDQVFLVTKVWPADARSRAVRASVAASLRRLGTDYLDAVLLHWPTRSVPLAETLGTFAELQAEGTVRFWGVSNFDGPWLRAAAAATPAGARLTFNEVPYSLTNRRCEREVLPAAAREGHLVIAYSPLAHGRLRPTPALQEIASAHGVSPPTVALAFVVSRPGVVAIPKAVQPDHLEANAAAGRLTLLPEEVRRLEAAYPLTGGARLPLLPPYGPFFRLVRVLMGRPRAEA
jgi:diketogulonate reductase-like aldo/keto reductase